jgi:hypothetical protein
MSDKNDSLPHQSALRLKKKDVEPEIIAPAPHQVQPEKEKKKKKKPGNASGKFGMRFLGQSIGSFLVACLLFGGFIYHQVEGLGYLSTNQATMARGVTVIAFFVILVIEAFTEDMIQGVLSLFLPPYAFVYGLFFADAGPIRGLSMAMLLFLGAEVYFYENMDDALVPKTTKAINEWIQTGQDKLINPDKHEAGFND